MKAYEYDRTKLRKGLGSLTRKEKEIVFWVADGRTNESIANKMTLTESSIKSHMFRILMKTGCTSRLDLCVLYYRAEIERVKHEMQ